MSGWLERIIWEIDYEYLLKSARTPVILIVGSIARNKLRKQFAAQNMFAQFSITQKGGEERGKGL